MSELQGFEHEHLEGGSRLPTIASFVQSGVSTKIFIAALFVRVKLWKQPKCESEGSSLQIMVDTIHTTVKKNIKQL